MPTKEELIAHHQTMVAECESILAKPILGLPEANRRVVIANLKKSKDWIEFLERPDTPELNW